MRSYNYALKLYCRCYIFIFHWSDSYQSTDCNVIFFGFQTHKIRTLAIGWELFLPLCTFFKGILKITERRMAVWDIFCTLREQQ